jgi:hypothetical protein
MKFKEQIAAIAPRFRFSARPRATTDPAIIAKRQAILDERERVHVELKADPRKRKARKVWISHFDELNAIDQALIEAGDSGGIEWDDGRRVDRSGKIPLILPVCFLATPPHENPARSYQEARNAALAIHNAIHDLAAEILGRARIAERIQPKTPGEFASQERKPATSRRKTPKKRKRANRTRLRPLTDRQAEVARVVTEHNGDLNAAAEELHITRESVRKQYDVATKKLAAANNVGGGKKPDLMDESTLDMGRRQTKSGARDGRATHQREQREKFDNEE